MYAFYVDMWINNNIYLHYKFHIFQIKKLNEDEHSRAAFEYSALLGDALTSEKDIEVWVGSHVVEFLIRLNVDTSRLPEVYYDG